MTRQFSNWLQEYLEYTQNSEAPDILHFWTGVAVVAGALRRRVWIDQRYFQWTPNFYIIFVAPPGVATKSTTVNVGMRILREVEDIHFGPNSLTWQGLTLALEEAKEFLDLGDEIFQPMSCLTIPVSELGTFLKPQDSDLVDLLVDLWDGQISSWRHKTKTQGEASIQNPWINIIGCTTPAWLRANFPMYVIEGGLTSRIVFVYAETKRKLVSYPADLIDPDRFKAHGARLLEDLKRIGLLQGEYTLTPQAKAWGTQWYEKHWATRPASMLSDRFGGYLARKQTHIHKLAIVMAAAQRDQLIITHEDLAGAERVVTGLENDLLKVFSLVGVTDDAKITAEVLAHIRVLDEVTQENLMQIFLHQCSAKELDEICSSLIRSGYVAQAIINGKLGYKSTGIAIYGEVASG